MPKLLMRHPERGEVTFALRGERITIGRHSDNTIQINHHTVSSYHAEMVALNGHYVIRDLGSTNHSYVEGVMFLEAELDRPCKLMLGTVECDYLPDKAERSPDELDTLRKSVGLLRRQNDELIAKIAQQQGQIQILGNARLQTPAAGANLNSLREQISSLTAERDRLAAEKQSLLGRMARLRELIAVEDDSSALKKNLAACLAPSPGERRDDTTIALERIIPPPARPLSPEFQKVSEVNKQLRAQIALLVMQPEDRSAFCAVLLIIEEMADAVSRIPEHSVARLVLNLQAMVRDGIQRPTAPDARILHGITQASDLLSHVLHHDLLARAASLPPPKIVAVDDDKDLLPLIIAALESATLPTIGCVDARAALDTLQETHCDLILMDVGLPDLNGFDTCACIRALPKHERTPIVFLTGQDTHENRTRGSLKGASDFIGKPFNVFELALKAHTWALKNQLAVD